MYITLKISWIDTKLGQMITIGNEKSLYLLKFVDQCNLEHEIQKLKLKTRSSVITTGTTDATESIRIELQSYFDGTLINFQTPLHLLGTPFQRLAWEEIIRTPYGATETYKNQAQAIGRPTAYRAVANANSMNPLAIIIPCHRIVNSNGALGGYSGGIARKQWLIEHEKKYV